MDWDKLGRLIHGLAWVLAAFLIALLAQRLWQHAAAVPALVPGRALIDFDAFYIAGELAHAGRAGAAYETRVMTEIQVGQLGNAGAMPWTYPPVYNLIAMALAALPRGLAYGLFVTVSAGAYLLVLAALAGRLFPWVFLALLPPVAITASIGQNGFLTGALAGAACLLALRGRAGSGYALGLLVIKPHLGIGLGILALASGRWAVLARAAGVAAALCGLATLVFGTGIWGAFLIGLGESGELIRAGGYPFYRMTTAYALALSLGLPAGAAMAVQLAAALGAAAAVALLARRRLPARIPLAAACFAAPLFGPYFYDYDLLVPGVGLALILPETLLRTRPAERALLLPLVWIAGGWGVLVSMQVAGLPRAEQVEAYLNAPAWGAAAYLLLLVMAARILARPPLAAVAQSG